MSMEVFLNIYDVTKVLISDWTAVEFALYSLNYVFARLKLHYSRVCVIWCRGFND